MASNGNGEEDQLVDGSEEYISSVDKPRSASQDQEELGAWFENIWSRLNSIPDSTDKYKSTCSAVQQLQNLLQEVTNKRDKSRSQIDDSLELSFKVDSLLKQMTSKQEQLFQGVVHFHRTELARIEAGLDEAERKLAESPLIKGYIEQQKHLHKLKDAREELSSYQNDLQQLVDSPQPHPLDSAHQQQMQQEVPSPLISPTDNLPSSPMTSTSPVFAELNSIQSRAQLTSLRCQELCQRFDERLETLGKELATQSDKFMKELDDVELWVQNVYFTLRQEPAREIEGIYSQDEMDAEEEEVLGQRSQEVGPTIGGGRRHFGRIGGTPDLFSSDGSLGSEGFMGSLDEAKVHDTSVNPDLSDDEYVGQMVERVITPDLEREVDVEDKEYEIGFSMSTNESDGEEGDREDEGGEGDERQYGVQFAMSPEPQEEEGAGPTAVEEESVVSESTLIGADQQERSSMDHDEASTVASTEQSEAVTHDTAETHSTSTSSKYSIPWVKGLGFLRIYHDEELDKDMYPVYQQQKREIDSILEDLEKVLGQMPIESQKMKRAMANTSFVMSTASKEQAADLQGRLVWVKGRWEGLAEKIKRRRTQLTFEKAEKAIIEIILETCQELKDQPDGVLLREEMEAKQMDLNDFIVDMDSYTNQMNTQLGQMDDSFDELKGGCPDKAELIQEGEETVAKLRKAYEDVARKVQEQKVFLDKSMLSWQRFEGLCVQVEDWLSRSEELVSQESYGYTLKDTEAYCNSIKQLKDKVPSQENTFTALVEQGKAMLESMDPQTDAELFMDEKLTDLEQRWTELVSQDRGSIDVRLTDVEKVLISWKGYTKMRGGTQTFVSQMTKIVGTEPLESSHGDQSKLPTYMTYAGQLKSVSVQYDRLMALGKELVGNPHVGGSGAIQAEVNDLKMKFEPLKDNVVDSLELLKREYNEWIMVQLQQMSQLVSQADDLTKRELGFVEHYPLPTLLDTEASGLLKEAQLLMESLDQVNQMETDCTVIEERLLERQIGHETSSDEALEYTTTLAEKQRLQEERERLLNLSDTLEPILRVFYHQLQLLGNIQEGAKVVAMVKECVGQKDDLEVLLADARLKLSEDQFEKFRSEAYDLGTIAEVVEEILSGSGEQLSISLASYEKVVEVNRSLTEEIETLSEGANDAIGHLQLILEWWAEFNSNHDDICPWLEDMEGRLATVEAQLSSSASPRPCPLSLKQITTELNEEVESKSLVVTALSSTGQSLMSHMITEVRSPELNTHINDVISGIKTRWEELKTKAELFLTTTRERGERFESFIDKLTDFSSWMSEFYSEVYDEFCERIPPKASDEIIAHHRTTLKRFSNEAEDHRGDYDSLEAESEEWAEFLIPEEFQENLLSPSEPSPPPFADDSDFPPPSQMPYVKRRTSSILSKWTKLQRLLKEREQQLEMSSGSMQEYLEYLQNLLDWIDRELKQDSLVATPPAHAQLLKGYLDQLQETGSEFTSKRSTRETVERLASSLKTQVTPDLSSSIDARLGELQEKWRSLEGKLGERKVVLTPILSQVEAHSNSCSEFEEWLNEQDHQLKECGPIGADLKRLIEQTELLKNLDEGLLERKGTAGDLRNEAKTFADNCSSESLAQLTERVEKLDTRYTDINQLSLERQERCEEALAAMQAFQKKVDAFERWLEEEEKRLEVHKNTKKPIGIIQSELESFYDLMAEVEQHTDDYNDLIPESQQLAAEYQPSTALDEMMAQLKDRWFKHVEQGLLDRCDKLLGLLDYWQRYEKEVTDLLSWIMDEANRFSKEVTTRGDKGIEDHIESCKLFTKTLQDKKTAVEGIEDLADLLRAEDGEKKNGTSDVESRWKDVNQHWNSLCKLLQETLLRLEATYAEVRHVLQIRREEFDWLDNCEHVGYMRRQIRGNLGTVQEEIESHEESLMEVEVHEKESQFITNTVPFLVEHSRKAVREEIRLRAEEHTQRYHQLQEFLTGYVGDLKDSIPFWQEFNKQTEDLGQWLRHTNEELESGRTQPGNATVTETSLRNTHQLQVDIDGHQEFVEEAVRTGNDLKRFVGEDDQEYITEVLERLKFGTQEVEQEAEERVEHLEERYKSWKVFPVEEARVVQSFLTEVEEEMEEDITDEMTADQLLEKLERLELLQQTQSAREGEVKAIDKSADSEEVKKALQKNPDISKERNNLLQGWSSVSGILKGKIASMRKRAKMIKSVEDALKQCERGLKEFNAHLDTPLLSPVHLANQQKELDSKTTRLHNQCRASLNDMKNVFGEYASSDDTEVTIPPHLRARGNELEEEFNQVVVKAKERTDLIEESASSWNEFSGGLSDFLRWLRTYNAELSSLKVVEDYAVNFTDFEVRQEDLTSVMPEGEKQLNQLKVLSGRFMSSENPEVVQVREQFERCEKMWEGLKTGVGSLEETVKPWRKITSQHEKLSDWFAELEEQAKRDLESVGEVDDDTTDVCDHIFKLKSHTERMSQNARDLQEIQATAAQLLTAELCQKHEPVKQLKEQCDELETKWEELREKMDRSLEQLENRHTQWKSDAIESIRKYMEVRLQLDELRDEKESEIRELKYRLDHRPATRRPSDSRYCACNGWKVACFILLVMVLLLVVVLVAVIALQVTAPQVRPI